MTLTLQTADCESDDETEGHVFERNGGEVENRDVRQNTEVDVHKNYEKGVDEHVVQREDFQF